MGIENVHLYISDRFANRNARKRRIWLTAVAGRPDARFSRSVQIEQGNILQKAIMQFDELFGALLTCNNRHLHRRELVRSRLLQELGIQRWNTDELRNFVPGNQSKNFPQIPMGL